MVDYQALNATKRDLINGLYRLPNSLVNATRIVSQKTPFILQKYLNYPDSLAKRAVEGRWSGYPGSYASKRESALITFMVGMPEGLLCSLPVMFLTSESWTMISTFLAVGTARAIHNLYSYNKYSLMREKEKKLFLFPLFE